MTKQLELPLGQFLSSASVPFTYEDTFSTFADNMKLPVLGILAQAAGFRSFNFEQTRQRNVKWKNRKHQVPLCEGCLWVHG